MPSQIINSTGAEGRLIKRRSPRVWVEGQPISIYNDTIGCKELLTVLKSFQIYTETDAGIQPAKYYAINAFKVLGMPDDTISAVKTLINTGPTRLKAFGDRLKPLGVHIAVTLGTVAGAHIMQYGDLSVKKV
jgi:hypothetical protein